MSWPEIPEFRNVVNHKPKINSGISEKIMTISQRVKNEELRKRYIFAPDTNKKGNPILPKSTPIDLTKFFDA